MYPNSERLLAVDGQAVVTFFVDFDFFVDRHLPHSLTHHKRTVALLIRFVIVLEAIALIAKRY